MFKLEIFCWILMFTPVVQYIYNFCIYYSMYTICMDTKGWMELVTQVGVCNYFWGISIKSWMELDTKVFNLRFLSLGISGSLRLRLLARLAVPASSLLLPASYPSFLAFPASHPSPDIKSQPVWRSETSLFYKGRFFTKIIFVNRTHKSHKTMVNLFLFVIRFRRVIKST